LIANKLKIWLQEEASVLSEATLRRTLNMLPDEEDLDILLAMVADNVGEAAVNQLSAVQYWALTCIGHDAPAARDWLTVLRVFKEEVVNDLEQQFRPEEALRFWRQLDDILTYALIEATQLSVDIERAVLLEHTVNIRRQLERLEETKTNFIAVAAHELKTPLTILEGYTNMLRYEADPDSKLHAYIDGLENGTQRMNEIISDIIDISLIDSQTFILNYQLFHLEKMIDMVVGRLAKYYDQRSVMLEVIPLGVEVRTFGDPERLSKALTKVLLNALKYTPDGGQVTVANSLTRRDEAIEGVLGGYVEMRVTDTGIGINPEHLETIFEKFTSATDVTLHSSGKTKFKGGGPGLGLPIAKGLIEAHGGRMWATSPGYDECLFPGSTFHMEIPICLRAPEGKGKRRVRPSDDWEV
jgi:signal transduction histidine kinase